MDLASFPCSYSTAENMLTRARVESGERVLVTGASGGVGSAAVQLAKARGAEVWAVTTPAKSAALRELGADETISRETDLTAAPGASSVDVVIDLVAGPKWPQYLDVLRPGGRYAVAGAIGGPLVELDVRTLYLKDLSLFGCTVLEPEVFNNLISNAIKFTTQGHVHVKVFLRKDKKQPTLHFDVEDTGIGIPDAILNKLLDSRTHVSTNGTRGEKGSGLGLKICQEIVQTNKGWMKVESVPGSGSTILMGIRSARKGS